MTFRAELQALLNKHSKENASNTPDFILARFLDNCLDAFDEAVGDRESFYAGTTDTTKEETTDG